MINKINAIRRKARNYALAGILGVALLGSQGLKAEDYNDYSEVIYQSTRDSIQSANNQKQLELKQKYYSKLKETREHLNSYLSDRYFDFDEQEGIRKEYLDLIKSSDDKNPKITSLESNLYSALDSDKSTKLKKNIEQILSKEGIDIKIEERAIPFESWFLFTVAGAVSLSLGAEYLAKKVGLIRR